MITATMAYSYKDDKWVCFGLRFGPALPECDYVSRILTDEGKYLFPLLFDAPVKSFNFENGRYAVVFDDGFKLPPVVTLEQSIERCKEVLSRCMK